MINLLINVPFHGLSRIALLISHFKACFPDFFCLSILQTFFNIPTSFSESTPKSNIALNE